VGAGRQAREAADLGGEVESGALLEKRSADLVELSELAAEDPELAGQLDTELLALEREIRQREIDLLFADPYADHNAGVSISEGQGGTDAQDGVEMQPGQAMKWSWAPGHTRYLPPH